MILLLHNATEGIIINKPEDFEELVLELNNEFCHNLSSNTSSNNTSNCYGNCLFNRFHLDDLVGVRSFLESISKNNTKLTRTLESRNCDNHTPLMHACYYKKIEMVKLLLAFKPNLETVHSNWDGTVLLQQCANITRTSKRSVDNCECQIIELLLEHGADPNYSNRKIRHLNSSYCPVFAVMEEFPNKTSVFLLKLLLKHGASLDVVSDFGKTPLHIAAGYKSIELCKVILDAGVPVDIVDKHGKTPLMMLSYCNNDFVQFLLNEGANINHVDHSSKTILYDKVYNHDCDYVKFLIEHGAHPALTDNRKFSCNPLLAVCVLKKCQKCIPLLICAGARLPTNTELLNLGISIEQCNALESTFKSSRKEMFFAFASGLQIRAGVESPVQHLNNDVLSLVSKFICTKNVIG